MHISRVTLIGLLLMLSLTLTASATWFDLSNLDVQLKLRNPRLNFEIENLLKRRFHDDLNIVEDVSMKYADFNGPNFFCANNATNMSLVNLAAAELLAYFNENALSTLVKRNIGHSGGVELEWTGLTTVATNYALVMPYAKVFGESYLIGDVRVSQVEQDLFRAEADTFTIGHSFAGQGCPTSPDQLRQYVYHGKKVNMYKRTGNLLDVKFKLTELLSFGRYKNINPPAESIGFVPYRDMLGYSD